VTVGLLGHTVVDTVVGPDGSASTRLGGTPLYARRALQAAGAGCVVVTRGADPGDAVVLPGGEAYDSRLDHRDGATRQELAQIGLPFSPEETRTIALPALHGCEWVLLGPQSAGEIPPETIAVLREAGHRLCMDGQGLARGPDPGPVRLRPFPPAALAGVAILKLNRAEAQACTGGRLDQDALLALGAPEVVVTLGGDGVLVATPGGMWDVPGTGAGDYEDPTGAGDCFTAAYLLTRIRAGDPVTAAGEAMLHTDLLYLAPRHTGASPAGTLRHMQSDGIRILIAEDNALLRGVLRDALEEAGMTVVGEASDGAEAVTVAERTLPDVVVMDMRMPNVDGIEATEQIAASEWAMPVVVLSAYDEPQMIDAALNAGAANCLKKGVGLDELIDAIRSATVV
jgi:CheY-like chemotaxis protein/sugar/nucleoside kinase (ribokinase family)